MADRGDALGGSLDLLWIADVSRNVLDGIGYVTETVDATTRLVVEDADAIPLSNQSPHECAAKETRSARYQVHLHSEGALRPKLIRKVPIRVSSGDILSNFS